MKKKFLRVVIGLLFMMFFHDPAQAQTLSEIYVSELGKVLGALFHFNPGFPSWALVNGWGILVWVNMEIPRAIVEIHKNGYVHLVERTSPGIISYANGRISKIEGLRFQYESGRIQQIGDLGFQYHSGRISRIGDLPIVIQDGFIRHLGNVHFEYENGRLRKIDGLLFTYESGRIRRIGQVQFDYDWEILRIRKVTGEIPAVSLKVSSVPEFRRSFR
ncbi:MAG: hypothetical protein HY882_08265 [Deltaproteobacteria bacterium]|nr:hypothetical protein [Deltaproteobacteria bacterium]